MARVEGTSATGRWELRPLEEGALSSSRGQPAPKRRRGPGEQSGCGAAEGFPGSQEHQAAFTGTGGCSAKPAVRGSQDSKDGRCCKAEFRSLFLINNQPPAIRTWGTSGLFFLFFLFVTQGCWQSFCLIAKTQLAAPVVAGAAPPVPKRHRQRSPRVHQRRPSPAKRRFSGEPVSQPGRGEAPVPAACPAAARFAWGWGRRCKGTAAVAGLRCRGGRGTLCLVARCRPLPRRVGVGCSLRLPGRLRPWLLQKGAVAAGTR